jgi:T-complex protein 1 subunit theta
MDDIERAIDDAVNNYKSALSNNKYVPGAGATEAILASRLEAEAKTFEDLN